MTYATEWERDFDVRTQECVDAKAERDSKPQPQVWPISGLATEWKPDSDNREVYK